MLSNLAWIIPLAATLLHLAGFVCAVQAIRTAGTPQGAVAWAVSLITFPYLAVPLYLVFGRSAFWGYVGAMRKAEAHGREQIARQLHPDVAQPAEEDRRGGPP